MCLISICDFNGISRRIACFASLIENDVDGEREQEKMGWPQEQDKQLFWVTTASTDTVGVDYTNFRKIIIIEGTIILLLF